jgi:3-hydroxyacyl-CoA dehydrogenase/enoyl-CoA hydratase/3-hydroxybutyryl-CoA epimerase
MTNAINLTIKNNIANLVFNLPNEKVNKLSAPVMQELDGKLEEIKNNQEIKILTISSAKKDIFIAGADINEIKDLTDKKDARAKVSYGQEIMNKIEELKIPTIAVINGACLGGGLELALACTYRLAITSGKTQIGLPEVNLGIIPGFGGTQRLPKLIGLANSLKIILSGKAVDARKAYKMGIVDDLCNEEFLEDKLNEFLSKILKDQKNNQYLSKRKSLKKSLFIKEQLLFAKYLITYLAQKDLFEKTKGNYPAPFYALEVIKKTYPNSSKKGYEIELDYFCELCTSQVSKNLIDIFFTSESLKKNNFENLEIKEINAAATLGAGIMGGGIAWLFANKNLSVRIKDISQNAVALGFNQVLKIFNQLKKIRKLTQSEIDLKMSKITSSLDYSGFENVDIVVEAVVENMAIKKNILAEVETKLKKDALIVSNTSSLSITEMAEALQNPERFAGMHFFNPVNRMPLVEVIYGPKTSRETIASVVALSKKLGKTPIAVKDVAGFLVNRILLTSMNEAAYLLQDGAYIGEIDAALEEFGMPMGPFILSDVVGIDVGVKVAQSLHQAYGERMKVAEILTEIYVNHKELLGKKANKGFYIHARKKSVNNEIYTILKEVQNKHKISTKTVSKEEIVNRCILTMVNEAAKCLEEGVVENANELDMAMIMGAGFPPFRGGLLKYADNIGADKIVAILKEFKDCGSRFEIANLLQEKAKNGEKFYN